MADSAAYDKHGSRTSRAWTPLHHLEQLTPERARALLRGGAELFARPAANVPSPLERAGGEDGAAAAAGSAEVRELLQRAARPWSPETHELFPARARARAVELLFLGHQLAVQPRFADKHRALVDCWGVVMRYAMTRDAECVWC
jgi:hypothetical protein